MISSKFPENVILRKYLMSIHTYIPKALASKIILLIVYLLNYHSIVEDYLTNKRNIFNVRCMPKVQTSRVQLNYNVHV